MYQAFYRKWRPKTFDEVYGQDHITSVLKYEIAQDAKSHAYLFSGSRGTGKTTCAKIPAKAVNCLSPRDGNPCGECEACRMIEKGEATDILEMDAASNTGVEYIRDIRDDVVYAPTALKYRVYIIDEVHMLSGGAFNALLKTLEEPPPHAVFILATTEPQRLPATILSRCQRFDFRRIPAHLIEGRLRQVISSAAQDAEDEAVALIARAAEGGMRDALSILDMCLAYCGGRLTAASVREVLGASDPEFMFSFAQTLIDGRADGALGMIDQVMRGGLDPAVFARDVTGHMRALLLAKTCRDSLDELLETTREQAERFTQQADGADYARLMRLMELFMRAESDMKWASQPRSVLELCAVRGCHPEREAGDEALYDRLAALEKAVSEGVRAAPVQEKKEAPKPRPKPAPASAPAQSGDAPVSDEAAQEGYKGTIKALDRRGLLPLCFNLKKGKFLGVRGDAALVEFSSEAQVHAAYVTAPERLNQINECLTEAFGRDMRLVVVTPGAPVAAAAQKPAGKAAAQFNMDSVLAAFPRDKIEIIDD